MHLDIAWKRVQLKYTLMHLLMSELQNQFPVTSSWFARLALHKAFSAGVQQVGLHAVAQVSESPVASDVLSANGIEVEKAFKEYKWHQRKRRTVPLLVALKLCSFLIC
jgi:hypothetical protein